ncbi:MAG: family 16 glycoside hydrolase [Candidatus Eiseniibacteriota bacterium]
MPRLALRAALVALTLGLLLGASPDPERNASPPSPPAHKPHPGALFSDDFHDGKLDGWTPDQPGVWSVWHGVLRADLPNERQLRSFLYAGSPSWTDVAVDLDVCGMRGVDKGVAVRVMDNRGIGVDLRGPGYQDVVVYRGDWPLGKAPTLNANGVWHHLRVEARGNHYRVFVNGELLIDREDSHKSFPAGRIALPAYTGGVGQCTVYYDNIVVTPLTEAAAASNSPR